MKEEVSASAGAQKMDKSGYELQDLKNIEFFSESPRVELEAVYRPGTGTPFSPTAFKYSELGEGVLSKNPFVLV